VTALRAEHVKKKEQRREQEETHELLHVIHPRARLRQKTKPRRMNGQGEIRRAHSRGDGEKNRHDDERRLRESEPERGAEKWRGARRRERGREYALKKRTGFAFTRARMQHAMHERLREDNFENAEEIEREDEHDHAQKQNEIRIGELRG